MVTLAAGTGVRQGEAFGLGVDKIDFLRRQLTVDRQLITLPGRPPYLAAPKTQASVRTIPLPQVVVDALGAHLNVHPPRPWCSPPNSAHRSAGPRSPPASGGRR